MKTEDFKIQLQGLFEDLASNCNAEWMSREACKKDAYDAYESALNLIDEMYSSVTRVEVITTESGREYSRQGSKFELLLQDDGRTLKLFEVGE